MTAQASSQSFELDTMPILKLYQESIEAWTRNYEQMLKSLQEMQASQVEQMNTASASQPVQTAQKAISDGAAHAYDNALVNWQRSGDDIFRRFVNQQVELCRFFGSRWQQYLSLPDQLSHCRTAADVSHVHAAFISRCASDYMHETGKLSQPIGEMMASIASARHA
jgi:hypothetical protein